MRRLLLVAGAVAFAAGITWVGLGGWQILFAPSVAAVQPLADGEQELAWIYPATSGEAWERLVAAMRNLEKDWPEAHGDMPALRVSFDHAFLEQTASVPQIGLQIGGQATLWIRWYKLSSETDQRVWLDKLRERGQPPLAIIGGDTSDRALDLARGLEEVRERWSGSPPLFLITTATADRYYPGDIQYGDPLDQENWPKLMQVYKERTFRFCFTNTRMAETVLDFVRENPRIWADFRTDPATLAGAVTQGNSLGALGVLSAAGHLRSTFLYALAWADDRYSQDLADRFITVFVDSFYQRSTSAADGHYLNNYVHYSVGDFYQPNPSEQQAVGMYLGDLPRFKDQHQLLALPTATQRARRFLRTLCRQAPKEVRSVVAISGDAITFNQIYRDREIAWNVLDLPVPLIFFSHRTPVDESAGFGQRMPHSGRVNHTGTQDLLLTRDIIEAVVQAAWRPTGWSNDAMDVRDGLRLSCWLGGRIRNARLHADGDRAQPLFDAEGNRQPRRGEHVIWLQPGRERARNLPYATITVWSLDPQKTQAAWERVREPLFVDYNQANEEVGPSMAANRHRLWRFVRALLPPVVLGALVFLSLREPLFWWLQGEHIYDREAIREWVREARVYNTLPELAQSYLGLAEKYRKARQQTADTPDPRRFGELRHLEGRVNRKREEILEHLKALGNPPTKIYPGQLPLFPIIYRLTVNFEPATELSSISWDSELPRQSSQYRPLENIPIYPGASVSVQYHLHAYMERQFKERQEVGRRLRLSGLGIIFALLALFWVYYSQRREREREHHRLLAQQQVNDADRLRLQEELRRQEAETRQQETERQNLELRSQIFANIGIMAGSYAHNIKNLLVRPNDLLRRCLDEQPAPVDQDHMLREVKQTLGTVTERLQQILQTVRRDPGKAEKVRIDLNELALEIHRTWADLAREKWKMHVELDLWHAAGESGPTPLWIEGDHSHLQQALENLLFNARDATFEMRNHLREHAREEASATADSERRQALIAAAGWKGQVVLRTRRRDSQAIIEVEDNGIGMSDEVRRRCAETHFSTKRNNALFAGLSAGMGLGLAFVTVILEHHGAHLEIDSRPMQGATLRIAFPAAM